MSFTPEQALAALDALQRLSRPWLGMRKEGAATIEIACVKCEVSERFAVAAVAENDENLNRWLAVFMEAHQHGASA